MNEFGERLKKLRKKAGLTQQQLANKIWVSKAAISNYELYERNPSPEILMKLARAFHVSTDYLLGFKDTEHNLNTEGLTEDDIQFLEITIEMLRKKNLSRK
ncbi:MAG: helix-turn-helix transcriptional regulator [Oscillospiraceae bacterium]|nr:helix-turn-helix transcriptional regulator [Oscillospiraceae bacterium]